MNSSKIIFLMIVMFFPFVIILEGERTRRYVLEQKLCYLEEDVNKNFNIIKKNCDTIYISLKEAWEILDNSFDLVNENQEYVLKIIKKYENFQTELCIELKNIVELTESEIEKHKKVNEDLDEIRELMEKFEEKINKYMEELKREK